MSSSKNDMFKELTDRFVESSIDRIQYLDEIIDNIYNEKGDRGELFRNFVQEVHSLKGSAGTFGFHLASTIAHRIEDYMESSRRLEKEQWLDVQKFIDALRDIFETGDDPDQKQHSEILAKLPNSSQQTISVDNPKTILLVMKSGVIRKHLGTELATKGFDISFAQNPIEALDICLKIHPDGVVSSQEFGKITGIELGHVLQQVEATKDIPFILMTSNQELVNKSKDQEREMKVFHVDKSIAENIANCF